MKLCFGTFARVLNTQRTNSKVTQALLVETLLCLPLKSYINHKDDVQIGNQMASRQLSCDDAVPPIYILDAQNALDGIDRGNNVLSAQDVAENFKTRVINKSLVKNTKPALSAILSALLEIMDEDDIGDIEVDKVGGKTKNALLSQSEFVLSEIPALLAGIFLYAVTATDNKDGQPFAKLIDKIYISNVKKHVEVVDSAKQAKQIITPLTEENIDILKYSDIKFAKHIISVISNDAVRIVNYDKTLTPDYNPYSDVIEPLINFSNWLYDGKNSAIDVQLEEYRQFLGDEIREFADLSSKLYEKSLGTKEYDDAYREAFASMQALRETYELLVRYCKERMPADEIDKINEGIYSDYDKYLAKVKKIYRIKKTYLHGEQEREFYSFYVTSDIGRRDGYSEEWVSIGVPSAKTVTRVSKHIIISGTGGLGKSMMMLHLLLNAVAEYESLCLLPVFLELKKFTDKVKTITDFIVAEIRCFDKCLSQEQIIGMLENGSCLLLFDGWDEVAKPQIERFEDELHNFAKEYSECSFILSTRPFKSFTSFRFTELHLQPLSKDQAIKLIKKLHYRPEAPDIAKNFIEELKNGLFERHVKFAGNPLLLMIMLRTYARTGRVPDTLYQFYEDAYNTLAEEHDASKGYTRQLNTGLSKEEFAAIFAEVCYHSYKDGDYEFSESDFKRYLSRVKLPKNFDNDNDFLFDTRANLCLMFLEGGEYRFMHRTFQEYFCALSLSRKLTVFSSTDSKKRSKFVKQLIDFFEEHSSNSDKVLPMLYEMLPEKVEEYVFIPFLEDMFNKYDSTVGNPYINYLFDMYENIHYTKGEVRSKADNDPLSNLYKFIIGLVDYKAQVGFDRLPFYLKFVTEAFDELGAFCPDSFTEEDFAEGYGPVEPTGYYLEVSFEYIFRNPKEYEDFVETLTDDEFILKKEYHAARAFLAKMKSRQTTTDNDILDEL